MHGANQIVNRKREVLNAGTAVLFAELVDLRSLVRRRGRFVVRKFHTRLGIPHDYGLETGALEVAFLHVLRVELDSPIAIEPHHMFQPHDDGLERQKIAGDVIDRLNAEAVRAPLGLFVP